MNKILKLVIAGLLSVGGITAVANTQTSAEAADQPVITVTPNVTEVASIDDARTVALNQVQGTVQFEYEDDDEYIFFIEADGYLYVVEIDAEDGEVHDIDKTSMTNSISVSEAQAIALAQVDGTITEFEVDDDKYEIKIVKDGTEYEIKIDRATGTIKDSDTKTKKNTTSSSSTTSSSTTSSSSTASSSSTTSSSTTTTSTTSSSSKKLISGKDAKNTALQQVSGHIHDMDYDYRTNVFKVEVRTSEAKIYCVEINAATGGVNSVTQVH